MSFKLSKKYKDFLKYSDASVEILEGTTASGKTTTGGVKFMLRVAKSKEKLHIISGKNTGIVEKNIINCDLGILDIFGDCTRYYPKGKGANGLPHIVMTTPNGSEKIIYILGYDNTAKWQYALGGQYGCIMIDEINTADMAYVRQAFMRCDYMLGTLNPDDPEREIYKEYVNRCRPVKGYEKDAPAALLEMLSEPEEKGWAWWYFSFEHNAGLSEEKKNKIKRAHPIGSIEHTRYILGLRGKAEGVIFDNYSEKEHCREPQFFKSFCYRKGQQKPEEYFVQFSAGLDTSYSKETEDTIAMSFIGITNKKRACVLDELVINNKTSTKKYAPSDVAKSFSDFLEKNRENYGFAHDVFIDSADQATISELRKFKMATGSIYNFVNANKKIRIIDRIKLQKGWMAKGFFLISSHCENYKRELSIYSWSDKANKTEPEDANDHMINSVQYAWIPYRDIIGGIGN